MVVSIINESNDHLHSAKALKQDEYFTRMEDIENELRYYDFRNKVVYCNCDDITRSNFYKYFRNNFDKLKLKKLITTGVRGRKAVISRKQIMPVVTKLHKDDKYRAGDFRSLDCIECLKEADIVVTNPPFSLFREFFNLIDEYHKDFLIVSNVLVGSYKNVFSHFVDDTVRFGVNKIVRFHAGDITEPVDAVVTSYWLTSLPVPEKEFLDTPGTYSPERYPKYLNYDAIEVSKLDDIPDDYYGVMGLPITLLTRHNPKQFKILGTTKVKYRNILGEGLPSDFFNHTADAVIEKDGKYKKIFGRVFVRRIR